MEYHFLIEIGVLIGGDFPGWIDAQCCIDDVDAQCCIDDVDAQCCIDDVDVRR